MKAGVLTEFQRNQIEKGIAVKTSKNAGDPCKTLSRFKQALNSEEMANEWENQAGNDHGGKEVSVWMTLIDSGYSRSRPL